MSRLCVQIGHVNGQPGAPYEEETLKLIVPHVVARLRAAGHLVTLTDGSLQYEPAEYQYKFDGALFCHCDSWSVNSTGFSIGYWEEAHPGSAQLAAVLRQHYGRASGLPFGGYNITMRPPDDEPEGDRKLGVGEAHYYGNRRFVHSCKCCLIEFGFVSNPKERAFLQANTQKLGHAAADAYIQYFGGSVPPMREKEDAMFDQRPSLPNHSFLDCYRDRYDYYVVTRGKVDNLRFRFVGHKGGDITTDPQPVDGVRVHNVQDLLKQERMKALAPGSFMLVVDGQGQAFECLLREVPKSQ